MINVKYNPNDLKAALYEAFSLSGVSSTVCVGARPKSSRKLEDFVVVRVMSDIKDKGAIGTVLCRIELYAKDFCTSENPVKLKGMLDASDVAFRYLTEHYPSYTFVSEGFSDSKSDGFGFHSLSIDLFTTIKN